MSNKKQHLIEQAERLGLKLTERKITTYSIKGRKHCHTIPGLERELKRAQCGGCVHHVPEAYRGDKPEFDEDHDSTSQDIRDEFWEERWEWWMDGCRAEARKRTSDDHCRWWDFISLPCPGYEKGCPSVVSEQWGWCLDNEVDK
jgi:hypothetical protein